MTRTRPYLTVVKDLEKRRASLAQAVTRMQEEYAEIDAAISALLKLTPTGAENEIAAGPLPGMSMRWAILKILATDGPSMTVSTIFEALKAGGFPDEDKTKSNAGAVLSRMVRKNELANNDGLYSMTEFGSHAWRVIQLGSGRRTAAGDRDENASEGG